MKLKTVTVKLAENVTYPLSERVCVHCRCGFLMNAFVRRLVCGGCAS